MPTSINRNELKHLPWFFLLVLLLTSCAQDTNGSAPVITSFSASDRILTSDDKSTLSWEVENATSLKITADTGKHVGDVTGQDRAAVTHTETTTHTLTATNEAGSATETVTVNVVAVDDAFPADIPGGAQSASLEDAAVFAWHEFIALNWPALQGARDTPDSNGKFDGAGPVVWETFRHKSEIYPGTGEAPHGGSNYDDPPQYIYSPTEVGGSGEVPPCSGQASSTTPYINLDEQSEIGLDQMFAGSGSGGPYDGQQILFLAKANKVEYDYVFANEWYEPGKAPFSATANYVTSNQASPPPGSTNYVSFPYGTVEMKAAWRKLTAEEASSGRFYTAPVRYYQNQSGNSEQPFCYVDEESGWGLVGLHIIQKTPTAPYFIYATFEQADNIKDASGNSVEDENGNLIANQNANPLEPMITSKNATAANPATSDTIQELSPNPANSTPGARLYYENTPDNSSEPQGTISINRRIHNIPETVIEANETAHQAITAYNQENSIADSPWLHYKLVNVQYQPIDKPTPGEDYTGDDAATYYQANITVETDYNLQVFSGQFQPGNDPSNSALLDNVNVAGLITDFDLQGNPIKNVYSGGHGFNMGGCMGCHGNAQAFKGGDFSFIILGVGKFNLEPEVGGPEQKANLDKYISLLLPSP
jgi:hypothetical protein